MNTTIAIKEVEYEQPEGSATCSTKYAWARVPAELTQMFRSWLTPASGPTGGSRSRERRR